MLDSKECKELLHIIQNERKNPNRKLGDINSDYKRQDLMLSIDQTSKYIKKVYLKIKEFCNNYIPYILS
jgi:hypothetical protein